MNVIGSNDNWPKWKISGTYGRQEELKLLNHCAEEGKSSSCCVLIQGKEGTGKTTLMHSVPWDQKGWVFVSRKYDKSLSTEPYSALIQALEELVEKIWKKNNEKEVVVSDHHQIMTEGFLTLLTDDFVILQYVIPNIFQMVSSFSQDERFATCRAGGKVTNQRLSEDTKSDDKTGGDPKVVEGALLRLFSFLCSIKPIVLFLDDVQFADPSSMEILELLMQRCCATQHGDEDGTNDILIALSYSDDLQQNKVALKSIDKIKNLQSNIHYIHLEDLDVDTVNEIVASVTNADPGETLTLSQVVHKKTDGNPFAVWEFLRYARKQGHFTFSSMTYKWEWGDVDKLDQYTAVSDNVAKILVSSIKSLSVATQVLLEVSSCLGKIIPENVLEEYLKQEFADNAHSSCVQIVLQDGLDNLLKAAAEVGILVRSTADGAYMWSNDRLQEAAYEMIPLSQRLEFHKKLGMLLWRLGLEWNEDWMIFMAANQLNKYADLQHDLSLGNDVAKLNFQAAKLSLKKGAVCPALDLLVNAEKHMVVSERWKTSYDLTLNILTNLAETKLRMGERDEAVEIAQTIVDNGKSLNDKFRAHVVMLQSVVSGTDRNYEKGAEMTLELLKLYGEKHPKKLFPGQKFVEREKLKKMLPGGELKGLLELPDMVDETALKIQKLLVSHLSPFAQFSISYKSLGWFASVRALKNSCKYGISPVSNEAVINMAVQMRLEGHYEEASEYVDFALHLSERIPRKLGSNHGDVRLTSCSCVLSAVRSFNHCLNEALTSRAECLRAGRVAQSAGSVVAYAAAYLCVGLPLGPLDSDLVAYIRDTWEYGYPHTIRQLLLIIRQTILNLQSTVENPTILNGDAMDQDKELEKVEGQAHHMTLRDINTHRLALTCFYSDWDTAENLIEALEEFHDANEVFYLRAHFRRCYLGLAGFALSRKAKSAKIRKKSLAVGKKMMKLFITEMKYGNVNAYPIVSMLEAEESP